MNRFEQFANTNQESFSNKAEGLTFYSGLAVTKIIAINPTEKQLGEIIGAEAAAKFDTTYEEKDNSVLNIKTRPIVIWVQDKDEKVSPTIMSIDISKEPRRSQAGNVIIINNKLQTSWARDIETLTSNERMSWFSQEGIHVAGTGEDQYYKLISQVLRFDFNNSKTNFFEFCTEMGIDFNTVLSGNFSGLHELVEHLNTDSGTKEPNYFVGLFSIKEKQDGNLRQEFSNKIDTWFRCSDERVSSGMVETLRKRANEALEQGRKLLGTREFIIGELQEFSKDSLNAPTEAVTSEDKGLDELSNFLN